MDPKQLANKPKLEAYERWKGTPPLHGVLSAEAAADKFSQGFQSYSTYYQFFEFLEEKADIAGWQLVRDAYVHYNSLVKANSDGVDAEIQQWMERQPPGPRTVDGRPDELGVCRPWFAEKDRACDTTYFTARLDLVSTVLLNNPTSPVLDEIDERITAALEEAGGLAGLTQYTALLRAQYDEVRRETIEWAQALYRGAGAGEEKALAVPGLVELGSADKYSTVEKQEHLKASLMRLYQQDAYAASSTWCTRYPERRLHEAACEYFLVREPKKLPLLDSILGAFAGQKNASASAADAIVAYLEGAKTDYAAVFRARAAAGEAVFFPPWRNHDYPDEFVPTAADFGPPLPASYAPPPKLPKGHVPSPEAPPLPYKVPREYFTELQERGFGAELAPLLNQGGGNNAAAAAQPAAGGTAATAAAADNVAGLGQEAGGQLSMPEETLTEADMVAKGAGGGAASAPGVSGDAGGAAGGGPPSRWDALLAKIAAEKLPEAAPEQLSFDPSAGGGAKANAEEKEGWLCFERCRENDALVVCAPAALQGTMQPQSDPLCAPCSARVLASRKAVWSKVDQYAAGDAAGPPAAAAPAPAVPGAAPGGAPGEKPNEKKNFRDGPLQVYIEKTGFLARSGWEECFVRATDTGVHYYSSSKESSLKQAKGSRSFSKATAPLHINPEAGRLYSHSELVQRYPNDKLTDANYKYIGFELEGTGGSGGGGGGAGAGAASEPQHFWMRTQDAAKHAEWTGYFQAALARFNNQFDDQQDPNPAKWRARVAGLLEQMELAKRAAEAVAAEARRAKQQRIQLEELKARAESDRRWAQTQASSAEQRAAALQDDIVEAERECEGMRREVAATCADTRLLREKAEELRRQAAEAEAEAAEAKAASGQGLRRLEAELEAAERERDAAQQETMAIYVKWRRCEERAPQPAQKRVETKSGLAYTPRNKGSGFGGL